MLLSDIYFLFYVVFFNSIACWVRIELEVGDALASRIVGAETENAEGLIRGAVL